jgi:hypothetical protein
LKYFVMPFRVTMTKFVEMDDRVTLNTNGPKHWPVIPYQRNQ